MLWCSSSYRGSVLYLSEKESFTPPTNGHHSIICAHILHLDALGVCPVLAQHYSEKCQAYLEEFIVLDIYFRQNKILAALPPLPLISPPLTVGLNWQTTGKHLRPWPKPTGQTSRIKIFASTSSDHLPTATPSMTLSLSDVANNTPDATTIKMNLQIKLKNMLLVRQLWWQQRHFFCVRRSVHRR